MSNVFKFLKDSMDISLMTFDDMLTLFVVPKLSSPGPAWGFARALSPYSRPEVIEGRIRSRCRQFCQALAPEVGRINRRAKAQTGKGWQVFLFSVIFQYIHTYIHTCMHTCIHTYIHTYIYICVQTIFSTSVLTLLHAQGSFFLDGKPAKQQRAWPTD